jgi:cell division cycle protein 37
VSVVELTPEKFAIELLAAFGGASSMTPSARSFLPDWRLRSFSLLEKLVESLEAPTLLAGFTGYPWTYIPLLLRPNCPRLPNFAYPYLRFLNYFERLDVTPFPAVTPRHINMVLDYSKWDQLELSDDSDIEVHPNVDKKSFIRAKQAQIHQERDRRRHQIATLKYERIINDGMLLRIDRLLTALKSHKGSDQKPDELLLQSVMESAMDAAADKPPSPPEGVHKEVEPQSFSKMMASLIDQAKKEVDKKEVENRYDAYITEITAHYEKVESLQKQLLAKLDELEKEAKKHITSEDLHTGFDYSKVAKAADSHAAAKSTPKQSSTIELLNPSAANQPMDESSGTEADVEDAVPKAVDADDEVEASPVAKKFAAIPSDDHRAQLDFISKHPEIMTERTTDGLLVEAFNSELEQHHKHARACVHAALLIQYCRQLGRDGVALFFKRISTAGHQANKLFTDDVRDTYARIRTRAGEIREERERNAAAGGGDVEQIQLHAVDPGTQIHIAVPPAVTESSSDQEKAAREIFESFPPGLRRALESGSLDEVNKVLGKMSVSEAEEVVGKLGDGGMLSLEEGIVDATTEEGKRVVEEIERTHKMPGSGEDTKMEGIVGGEDLSKDPE